jgi:uncharacterized protein YjbI with pentapeptide repeats
MAALDEANLMSAWVRGASLRKASLGGVGFRATDLSESDLTDADLEQSRFIATTCHKTIFTGCRVHGVSAWNLKLSEAKQNKPHHYTNGRTPRHYYL